MGKTIVFVEPISTIKNLIPLAHNKGYDIIAIFTNYKVYPENVAYELEELQLQSYEYFKKTFPYIKIIKQPTNYEKLLSELKTKNVVAVFKGSDGGVKLAEKLCVDLDLPHNNANFFDWALNKKTINEKLVEKKIRSIKTIEIDADDDIDKVIKSVDFFPVFIKPVAGAGGSNSFISYNAKSAKENLTKIFSIKNGDKKFYDKLLVQELINGNEYVVNTFSEKGMHYVVEVWKYIKEITASGAFIYRNTILLNTNSVIKEKIMKYAIDVLDALEFKNGPCHMEIKVDNRGPVLIECNWRIMGGSQFYDTNIALNSNCCEIYLECFLDKKYCLNNFAKAFVNYDGYAECLEIMPQINGTIKKINIPYLLKKMPSFHRDIIFVEPGYKIVPANNIDEDLGNVQFMHNDYNVLKNDIDLFEEIKDSYLELFFELNIKYLKKEILPINSRNEIESLSKFVGHKKICIFTNENKLFNFANQEFIDNFNTTIPRCEYLLIDIEQIPNDNIKCFDWIDELEKNIKPNTIIIFSNKTINAAPVGFKYLCCLNNLKIMTPSWSPLIDDFSFFKKK